jgi:hypothetical protein
MKTNELRVGNWVNDESGAISYQIRPQDFLPLSLPENEVKAKPITLTPEILRKAGFVKYDWMDGYFIKTKFGDLMIQFLTHRVCLYFTNVGGDSQGMKMRGKRYVGNINTTQNITYLHQLQNLYFALTGKELNIEL